ncbi:response regulator transcription factor [Bacillus solitudinis]|uniref:response regulator transcription factor n=1 Tax=Bacillus solitudinis TaxID=2014074 RepID=UPI000C248802|nr:response regulator [Bacillus solitudinis]
MKSFKVMIVDDEILAIEHIKSLLDWKTYGFDLVAEAVTAKQAIVLAEKTRPDVIFMDIRMPAMDGLTTSKYILEKRKNVKIVLLTSHRDFDYAKEAMKLGITNYLLKHEMNGTQLSKELKRLREDLLFEREKEANVISHNLRQVVAESPNSQEAIEQLEEVLGDVAGYALMYVKIDSCFPVIEINEGDLRSINLQKIVKNYTDNLATANVNIVDSILISKESLLVLFESPSKLSDEQLRVSLYQPASIIQKVIIEEGITATILLSPLFKKIRELPNIFKQTESKSSFLLVYGRGNILRIQDICKPSINNTCWNKLVQKMSMQSDLGFKDKIDFAFDWMTSGQFHPTLLKAVCQQLVHQLEQLRKEQGMSSYFELHSRQKLNIDEWYDLKTIKQWFLKEHNMIINTSNLSSKYSKKVELTIKYIYEHYQNELSVETIGEALSLSGDYVRHIFKKETGKTILEYVTWYRVEKAKELLLVDSLKVYEISEAVGYKTSQYFSKVFKKMTGMTPYEFKDNVGKR